MSLAPNRKIMSRQNNAIIHSNHSRFFRWILLAVLAISLPMSLALATRGQAAPEPAARPGSIFVVNSLLDDVDDNPGDGVCATPTAINARCAPPSWRPRAYVFLGPDTIEFDPSLLGGVIVLNGAALPTITEDLLIQGPAAAADLEIDAASDSRHFIIQSGVVVEIASLHLSRGYAGVEASGGSIYNGGSLTLTGVIISDSTAGGDGGAVYGSSEEAARPSRVNRSLACPDQGNSASYGGAVSISGKRTPGHRRQCDQP